MTRDNSTRQKAIPMTRHLTSTAAALTLAIAALAGCSGNDPAPSASAASPSASSASGAGAASATAAPANGATLDAAAFAAALKAPHTTILDVRTPAEFASGHLEGAVNADIEGDFAAAIADLDKAAPYAVYCRSGNRSAIAVQAMQQAGFTATYHLDGGITAWQAAGGTVVTG